MRTAGMAVTLITALFDRFSVTFRQGSVDPKFLASSMGLLVQFYSNKILTWLYDKDLNQK